MAISTCKKLPRDSLLLGFSLLPTNASYLKVEQGLAMWPKTPVAFVTSRALFSQPVRGA